MSDSTPRLDGTIGGVRFPTGHIGLIPALLLASDAGSLERGRTSNEGVILVGKVAWVVDASFTADS
jgi:hypothetical protein